MSDLQKTKGQSKTVPAAAPILPDSAPDLQPEKKTPYTRVQNSRNELADAILKNLKKEGQLLPPAWDRKAVCPQNPVSKTHYYGANLLKLMYAAVQKGTEDPRWCTYKQAAEMGWQVKRGAKGVLCEKWIYTKEVDKKGPDGKILLDKHDNPIKETVRLKNPIANYFILFNFEDIKGITKLELPELSYDDTLKLAEDFIRSSECPIQQIAQKNAFYDPANDRIVLPPKDTFRTTEDFLQTALHEMAHSTGHPNRLNRPFMNMFGTPDYAREELNAELGAIFTKFDIGLAFHEGGYIETRNQQYIKSWIEILEKEQTEFFKACTNAEKISRRLVYNYDSYLHLQNIMANTFSTRPINPAVQKTGSVPLHTDTGLSNAEAIRADFKCHHFDCTPQLLQKIQELNKITNRVWSLKDIHQKSSSHEPCISKDQELIKDIANELRNQELSRSPAPQICD